MINILCYNLGMKWSDLSSKQRAYAYGFAALALVMLWAFISAGMITHDFNRTQLSGNNGKKEAIIKGIILTETKNEKKYWELYGESGTYDSSDQIAMMDNVVGNFYKDNEVSMSFQSSKGSYNAKKKVIVLYQDTFVVLKDGITLKADRLRYPGNNEPITAYGNVKITRGDQFSATADEIEISPDFESFIIRGRTTSNIFEEAK